MWCTLVAPKLKLPKLVYCCLQGLTHFDEILQEADGIILSRGNLGIDLPPEKVCNFLYLLMEKLDLYTIRLFLILLWWLRCIDFEFCYPLVHAEHCVYLVGGCDTYH